jgi:ketosteroid isomerase-like protein
MFDVPPPFLSRGLDAYMATWETFSSMSEKPVAFALDDVKVTCGLDAAFATALGRCVNIDSRGVREQRSAGPDRSGCWRKSHQKRHYGVQVVDVVIVWIVV